MRFKRHFHQFVKILPIKATKRGGDSTPALFLTERGENVISRRGICYDLKLSKFRSTQGDLTFVFSSLLHKQKFEERLKENRDTINYSLTKRFGVKIDVSPLADVVLYKKIETRGFLIVVKDGKAACPDVLKFVGNNLMMRN